MLVPPLARASGGISRVVRLSEPINKGNCFLFTLVPPLARALGGIFLPHTMSNPYFRFKQFTVRHDRCAMKVGTDGCLLGAWADVSGARRIADVGTGSGRSTSTAMPAYKPQRTSLHHPLRHAFASSAPTSARMPLRLLRLTIGSSPIRPISTNR